MANWQITVQKQSGSRAKLITGTNAQAVTVRSLIRLLTTTAIATALAILADT